MVIFAAVAVQDLAGYSFDERKPGRGEGELEAGLI